MPAERHIEISSEDGCKLNVCNTFPKHFKLCPMENLSPAGVVCRSCWEALRDIHTFFERVVASQNKLDSQQYNVAVDSSLDPLPSETPRQNTGEPFENEKPYDISNTFEDEIKLEIQELDLLPKIEFFEELPIQSERTQRANRRRKENSPETAKVSEIPILCETEQVFDTAQVSEKSPPPVLPLKRRRGRPRKTTPTLPVTVKVEPEFSESETKPKTEIDIANDSDDGDGNNFMDCAGTDDSSDSSSDTSDSDKSLPEYAPKPRYAVIPKRVVVKPKKYRKRQKPLVPIKHLTPEEKERRNALQEELDRVIKSFFGGFICPKCDLHVKNFCEMSQHFRASHNEEVGYMTCCGRKFNKRKSLADHVYLHWNPMHFKCTKCDKILADSQTLKMHELKHTEPQEFIKKAAFHCDKCPKVFKTIYALEEHTNTVHVPKSEFKFPCTECNKVLPTQRKLKEHIRYIHNPEISVICDKCGKMVRGQTYLKKHNQLMHPDVPRPTPTPMQCKICGTWYRHLAGLKQHMKSIHVDTGEEHRCKICNKLSVNARALNRHIYLNHKCAQKFKCNLCEKAFKRPQDLKEHVATHTGQALYTCPYCPVTFVSKANMYKHRKRLHPIEWAAEKNKPKVFNTEQNTSETAASTAAMDLS